MKRIISYCIFFTFILCVPVFMYLLNSNNNIRLNIKVKYFEIEQQTTWRGREFSYLPNVDTSKWIAYGFVNVKLVGELQNVNDDLRSIKVAFNNPINYEISAPKEDVFLIPCTRASTMGVDTDEQKNENKYLSILNIQSNIFKTNNFYINTKNSPMTFYMWQKHYKKIDHNCPLNFKIKFIALIKNNILNNTFVISDDTYIDVLLPILRNDKQ